mmetsp:Transcript_688/g.2750  ORF Transcript_688/g.2750 Transcript_688/m.2750 type:complete len:538 (-) Transcript_688:4519-6132(-)|eukprot:scaffold757_cov246-Pinguiococcus_pyrenoidosus.AAC.9
MRLLRRVVHDVRPGAPGLQRSPFDPVNAALTVVQHVVQALVPKVVGRRGKLQLAHDEDDDGAHGLDLDADGELPLLVVELLVGRIVKGAQPLQRFELHLPQDLLVRPELELHPRALEPLANGVHHILKLQLAAAPSARFAVDREEHVALLNVGLSGRVEALADALHNDVLVPVRLQPEAEALLRQGWDLDLVLRLPSAAQSRGDVCSPIEVHVVVARRVHRQGCRRRPGARHLQDHLPLVLNVRHVEHRDRLRLHSEHLFDAAKGALLGQTDRTRQVVDRHKPGEEFDDLRVLAEAARRQRDHEAQLDQPRSRMPHAHGLVHPDRVEVEGLAPLRFVHADCHFPVAIEKTCPFAEVEEERSPAKLRERHVLKESRQLLRLLQGDPSHPILALLSGRVHVGIRRGRSVSAWLVSDCSESGLMVVVRRVGHRQGPSLVRRGGRLGEDEISLPLLVSLLFHRLRVSPPRDAGDRGRRGFDRVLHGLDVLRDLQGAPDLRSRSGPGRHCGHAFLVVPNVHAGRVDHPVWAVHHHLTLPAPA